MIKGKSAIYDHAKELKAIAKAEKIAKSSCKGLCSKLSTNDIILIAAKHRLSVSVIRHFIKKQGDYLTE